MQRMLWVLVCLCCAATAAHAQPVSESPTLRQLAGDKGHRREKLRAFWSRVTESGTPIVEPIEGDNERELVTFVWRDDRRTKNVGVMLTAAKHPLEPLTQLPGTDVWFLSTPVPKGARFTYRLAVNAPLVTEGPGLPLLLASLRSDPLNHHPWACVDETNPKTCESSVEMHGAPDQPWAVSVGSSKGRLESSRFASTLLHNERSVTVYTPAGESAAREPYDLLIVFDEGAYLSLVPTPTILDNLIAAGRIRPTMAVFLGNPDSETRVRELRANPVFVEALAEELLPWMHARYRVTADPTHVTLAGSSLGGLMAAFAAFRRSDLFGNVLCQSGDFSWSPDHQHAMGRLAGPMTETGWLAKQFIASPVLPIRFYLDAGVFEVDQFGTGGMILETSRTMRDVLLAKGYSVTWTQFVGGHDYLSWRGTFAEGLIALQGR